MVVLYTRQFSKKLPVYIYTQCKAQKGVSSLALAGAMEIQ